MSTTSLSATKFASYLNSTRTVTSPSTAPTAADAPFPGGTFAGGVAVAAVLLVLLLSPLLLFSIHRACSAVRSATPCVVVDENHTRRNRHKIPHKYQKKRKTGPKRRKNLLFTCVPFFAFTEVRRDRIQAISHFEHQAGTTQFRKLPPVSSRGSPPLFSTHLLHGGYVTKTPHHQHQQNRRLTLRTHGPPGAAAVSPGA